ncbi:MAG: MBL fold metallo-hydrolase [Planctomycetota bacterium]
MKLHFLGTTGYHPNDARQTACLMIPEAGIVFDAGTGIFRMRDLIQTDTVNIFLSHIHLDHSIGLTFLYDILFEKPDVRVIVRVDEEKIPALKEHLYARLLFPVEPNFEIEPLGDGPIELDCGAVITSQPVEHPGGCHAFRADWPDRSLAYVTDTVASDDAPYLDFIRGVDTLIHECYFPDGWEDRAKLTGHSCLTPVARVAASSGANRLFLVHINPMDDSRNPLDVDSVKSIFADVQVAEDKMVIDF